MEVRGTGLVFIHGATELKSGKNYSKQKKKPQKTRQYLSIKNIKLSKEPPVSPELQVADF